MLLMRSFSLAALALFAGQSPAFGTCPAKISAKLCPLFEATPDSAYLQVRIDLDPKVESSYVWDKSLPRTPRPLLTYSKDLIAKYDLRQFEHPESAYVPMYPPQDIQPAIDEVQYHNASVTRQNVGKLVSETYVAAVELGCPGALVAFCTEINTVPDSARIFFSLILSDSLEEDSAARKAYLSKYDIRDTSWTTSRCMASGYMGTPVAIRSLATDPEIRFVEHGFESCILPVDPGSKPYRGRVPVSKRDLFRSRRLDGRAMPISDP